jgi:hypothetical protein
MDDPRQNLRMIFDRASGQMVPDLRRRILNPTTGRMVLDPATNRRRVGRSPSPAARRQRWQVAVHASGLPPCAAITKVGTLLALSSARSLACIAVGVHYLGSGELEGWQPWTACIMLAREVLSIVVTVLETCDNPACLLSSPLAHDAHHLGIEVLVGPLVALASDPGTARYTSFWAMAWVFDVVVGLWWCLDWAWPATAWCGPLGFYLDWCGPRGFLGGLATKGFGTQPAWLTAAHVVTSGRSALCSLALLAIGLLVLPR